MLRKGIDMGDQEEEEQWKGTVKCDQEERRHWLGKE